MLLVWYTAVLPDIGCSCPGAARLSWIHPILADWMNATRRRPSGAPSDDVGDGLQGAEDVAVPQEPLEPFELLADLGGRIRPGRVVTGVVVRRRVGVGTLAMLAITVIRMVMWNQSSRCSDCGLR